MIGPWARLCETVEGEGLAALASIVAVAGSAPRESGARMVVRADGGFWGTVGGGTLEWRLLELTRAALASGRGPALLRDWPLGPDLGQCCGGRVTTSIETFDRIDLPGLRALAAQEAAEPVLLSARIGVDGRVVRTPASDDAFLGGWTETCGDERRTVLLFGAGHVGRALVLALAPLPVRVRWIDPRPEAFPALVPANAVAINAADPIAELAAAPAGAEILVMTHSHPLDLALVEAALRRPDLGHVGLIGSATKRARFASQLRAGGLGRELQARLVCPIGIAGITGKEPAVIAVAVAAQLMQWHNEADTRRHGPALAFRVAGVRR